MPKLTPSEAKMIVTGAQTMYCTRCTFHFLAGSDGIIRHGAPTDEGLYPEGILTWFEGCPLAGKSFAFPEALPIVGIEVPHE